MTEKEFNLSEKECNILVEESCEPMIHIEKDEYETKIITHNGESVYFKKGFFTEDIKEFIKIERDLLNELFQKINKQDIGRGIIYKKDWDEFIIKRDKLAGSKISERREKWK